jgi:hypothetical protein
LLALLKDVAIISVQVIESTFGWMVGAFDSQVIRGSVGSAKRQSNALRSLSLRER